MQWNEFRSHIRHLPAQQQELVRRAFELGKKMHQGQKRRSGEPYFNHPIAVAHMLADMGADTDTIVAALLHDTVEDTSLTLEEIRAQFDDTVAALIEGVTKLSKADVAEQPNLDEAIETLRKIFTLMQSDIRIMVIKLVDRLHNMQTVEFLPPEKQRSLAKETMEVYVKIADRLCMQDLRDELEGLCLSILEPANFAMLSSIRAQNARRGEEVIRLLQHRIEGLQAGGHKRADMQFEYRSWESLNEQMLAQGGILTGGLTLTTVFSCATVEVCYAILGILHQLWKRETLSFQDYINSPAVNGYRGLHTTMILEDGTRVRCKIRTREMQEYARRGVTTFCFTQSARNVPDALAWTKRISSVSQDTEGSSKEFWQTLQSDILGESIMIHGPGDETVLVPKGSTALDGAFYLLGQEALKIVSVRVGGKETEFQTPLGHAMSLSVTLAPEITAERSWLSWVRTGFASAIIRTALVQGKSDAEKLPLGEELLQTYMSQHRKGFIEEFDERRFAEPLRMIGYGSLPEAYIAIADGRLEPAEVYRLLFEQAGTQVSAKNKRSLIRYRIDSARNDLLLRTLEIHREHRNAITEVTYRRKAGTTIAALELRLNTAPDEQQRILDELALTGAADLTVSGTFSRLRNSVTVAVLVALWGLDPLFARQLVTTALSAIDLTFIRFATFFVASFLIYARQAYKYSHQFKPLSPLHPLLFFSGCALYVTGLFSYLALRQMPASLYILFIITGLVATLLLRHLFARRSWVATGIMLALLVAMLGILASIHGTSAEGVLLAIVSSMGFSLYSLLSKRYQEEIERVRERYPAYLFWVSAVCLLLSLPLLGFDHMLTLSLTTVLKAVSFALVFAAIPYVLYFELMRRMDAKFLDSLLPFVCISTFVGEAVFNRSLGTFLVAPLILLFMWELLTANSIRKDLL